MGDASTARTPGAGRSVRRKSSHGPGARNKIAQLYEQVATRRYVDEQAVSALMRFADEPSERVPSRQMLIYRAFVMGTAGLEPATSRV